MKNRNGSCIAYRTAAALLAAVLGLILFTQSTEAYNPDLYEFTLRSRDRSGVLDVTDPAAWRQGIVPADTRQLKAGKSSDTLLNGGCSYFAAAYMLLKMGQLNVAGGESPLTVVDKMEAIRGWLTWGKMDFTRINEAYPDVQCAAYKALFKSSDFHSQLEEIRGLMRQGYFVIVCLNGDYSNGHYVFVDSVSDDNDDMVLGDSSYAGTSWSDIHGPDGGYLVDYSIFTCAGADPVTSPSIYTYNPQEKKEVGFSLKEGLPNQADRKAFLEAKKAEKEASSGDVNASDTTGSSDLAGPGENLLVDDWCFD